MLMIRRKVGERVVFAPGIEVIVAMTSARAVRLAILAPEGISVLRGEVFDAIVAANATASCSDLPDLLQPEEEAHVDA